jgi:uncharacterized membrane protein YhaH (DUF805 family)
MGLFCKRTRESLSIEAIITGAVTDHVLTLIIDVIILVPFAFTIVHVYVPPSALSELMGKLATIEKTSQAFLILSTLLGGLMSIFGGYLAASMARKSELLNGFVAGLIGLFIAEVTNIPTYFDPKFSSYYEVFNTQNEFELARNIVAICITPLLALSGAYFCLKLKERGFVFKPQQLLRKVGPVEVFNGRMGRWSYLCSGFALVLIYLASIVVSTLLTWTASAIVGINLAVAGVFVYVILTLIGAVFSYSLTVRRLHDIGLNGWLGLTQYIYYFGPVFGIVALLWPGTKGVNKYGEPHDEFSLAYVFTGK